MRHVLTDVFIVKSIRIHHKRQMRVGIPCFNLKLFRRFEHFVGDDHILIRLHRLESLQRCNGLRRKWHLCVFVQRKTVFGALDVVHHETVLGPAPTGRGKTTAAVLRQQTGFRAPCFGALGRLGTIKQSPRLPRSTRQSLTTCAPCA